MCVTSMVSDFYMQKWPQPSWPHIFPPTLPQTVPAEWYDYQELLRKAREYDKLTGQPDCPDPIKVKWQKEFEEFMSQRPGFQPKVGT